MVKKIVLLRAHQKERLLAHRKSAFDRLLSQNAEPNFWERILLPLIQAKEIVHPNQKIFTYKRIGRRVFDVHWTGYNQIDSVEEYLRIFGEVTIRG